MAGGAGLVGAGFEQMMQIMVTQKRSIGRRAALPPDSRSRSGRRAQISMRRHAGFHGGGFGYHHTNGNATQQENEVPDDGEGMHVFACLRTHLRAQDTLGSKKPWTACCVCHRAIVVRCGSPGRSSAIPASTSANTAPVYTRGSRGGHREKDAHGRRDAPVHHRAGGERVSGPSASRPGPYSWSPWPLGQWRVRRGGPIDLFWVIGKEAAPPVGR